jgi:hypothetical protein
VRGKEPMASAKTTFELEVQAKDAIVSLKTFQKEADKASAEAASSFQKLGKVAATVGAGFAAYFSARAITQFLGEGIEAANAQEKALASLGNQLQLTGDYSQDALDGFAAFADEMERTTTFGDDAILSQLALAKTFGATNDQAKDLVRAASELSAVTGDSLDSSVQKLGKTLTGSSGALDKTIAGFNTLTEAELKAGKGIEFVLERFGGSQAAQAATFAGSITQMANAYGNLQEAVGKIIIENPALIAAIQEVRGLFTTLEEAVSSNSSTLSSYLTFAVQGMAVGFSTMVEAVGFFVRALGGLDSVADLVFLSITESFREAIKFIVKGADKVADVFGIDLKTNIENVDAFFDDIGQAAIDTEGYFEGAANSFAGFQEKVDESVQRIFTASETARASSKKLSQEQKKTGQQTAEELAKLAEEAKKFEREVSLAGLTEIQKVVDKRDEQFAKLQQLTAQGVIDVEKSSLLRLQIEETAIKELTRIREEADAKALEDAKKISEERARRTDQLSRDPFKLAVEGFDIKPAAISDAAQDIAAVSIGVLSKMLEGSAGAKSLISSGAGAFAEAFLPGIGGAVTSVVSKLAEGPEATKEFIRQFIDSVPDIIIAVAESIPVVVEAFVDTMVNKGGALRIAMAFAKALSGEAIFKAIGRMIGLELGNIFNASNIARTIGDGFEKGISYFITRIQSYFGGDGFKNAITAPFKAIFEFFKTFKIAEPAWLSKFIANIAHLFTTPDWLQPFIDAVEALTNWEFDDPLSGDSAGRGSWTTGGANNGEDPTITNWNGGKDEPLNPFNLTAPVSSNSGGTMAVLLRIEELLSTPQTVNTTVKLDGKAFADISLKLNRRRQRLA